MKNFNVKRIRKDFPILERKIHGRPLVYFDNAASTQKPRQVIEAVSDYYKKHNANVHRGIHTLSQEATEMVEEVRGKTASFIGAERSEEIVFVRNATEAINLVMYTWGRENLKRNDSVVVSLLEHHSNLVPWQRLVKEKNSRLKVVDIDEQGRLQMFRQKGNEVKVKAASKKYILGSLEGLLDEKVKIVAVTQSSNVLGTINPMKSIVSLVRKKAPRAIIVVDGAQSVPHMPVDMKKLGVDFFVFSGHKMLGPTGIGVLWGKKELFEKIDPFLFGGDMISEVTLESADWNKLPWKFEAGTPNMAGIVGLGAAIDYLESVGIERVHKYEEELVGYVWQRMKDLQEKGLLEVYGPEKIKERSAIVSFNINEVHAHDTAQILDSEGIAVRSGHHCAMPLTKRLGLASTARASFYLYNTLDEVEKLIEGIGKIRKVFRLD
jgi:cysteine desulfurase/selenocysteine lyase